MFWSVRTKELRAAKWSVTGTGAASNGRDQKRAFVKGMLYIGASLLIWIPSLLNVFLWKYWPIALHYIICFFFPLQGVLNVLIYSDLFNTFKKGVSLVMSCIGNLPCPFGCGKHSESMPSSATAAPSSVTAGTWILSIVQSIPDSCECIGNYNNNCIVLCTVAATRIIGIFWNCQN